MFEHVWAQQFEVLPASRWNAVALPLTDGRRSHSAQSSYSTRTAKKLNDVGIFHAAIIGRPMAVSIGCPIQYFDRLT